MLSIFPLLIFLLALVPYLNLDVNQLYVLIDYYIPEGLAELVTTTILDVVTKPQGGLLSFGIIATIWSASNGLNALIRAINRSYNIEETRHLITVRFLSIFMTLGMILVIVATLLLPVFGNLIIIGIDTFFTLTGEVYQLLHLLRWVVGISLMTLFLMVLYWLAPNIQLKFRNVVVGALVATIGWQIISYGFSLYVSNFSNYSTTYGSLGAVVILMLWFFLSGIILVIGGEINASLYQVKKILKKKLINDV